MSLRGVYLFDCNGIVLTNPGELCVYAQRMPPVRPNDDAFLHSEGNMKREAFQMIIDSLWKNGHYVLQTWAWLRRRMETDGAPINSEMFESLSTLAAIDTEWLASFLCVNDKFGQGGFDMAIRADPHAAVKLLEYGLAVNAGSLRLPLACKSKKALAEALLLRARECGDRLVSMPWHSFLYADDCSIDWGMVGVFTCSFDECGDMEQIFHRTPGAVVDMPNGVRITRRFDLEENWRDHSAFFVNHPARFRIANFWANNEGPKETPELTQDVWDNIVVSAVDSVRVTRGKGPGKRPAEQIASSGSSTGRRRLVARHSSTPLEDMPLGSNSLRRINAFLELEE